MRWFGTRKPVDGIIGRTSKIPIITWENLFRAIRDPDINVAVQIDHRILPYTWVRLPPQVITPILKRLKESIDRGEHPGIKFAHNASRTILIMPQSEPRPEHLFPMDKSVKL